MYIYARVVTQTILDEKCLEWQLEKARSSERRMIPTPLFVLRRTQEVSKFKIQKHNLLELNSILF